MNLEKIMEEKNAMLEVITEKCQKLEAKLAEVIEDRDLWLKTEAACNEQYNILSVEHEKLEAENKRLLETLEGIISCAENVRVTYADTNQHIIDMARQAQEAEDESV
jgi:chromosome segregation ATPase